MNTSVTKFDDDATDAQQGQVQQKQVTVWDPLVRIFHWSLVSAFFIAYFTEDDLLDLHVYAGYVVAGLLVFRLIWGLVGSRHARFTDFVKRPSEVWAYLKSIIGQHPRRYLGHNPAGGAMIIALLSSLVLVTISGIVIYSIEESAGPLGASLSGVSEFWEDVVEELHEFFSNATLALVFFHVTGVLIASLQHKENLVKSMVNGRKPVDEEDAA
ncbi:MAG: cytochrome b/b6 domain-containing protein [Gammaproteobacteria bacterium]|nr:cytochrome b/b6 domain-containing protein [Gammaproteobacteria bacterium]MCF6259569.1 cytochrome b/b6 domain-containing protein [Gammaproteobacteria bacterium]